MINERQGYAQKKSPKRKAIQSTRFFLFDLGLTCFLSGIDTLSEKTDLFGKVFEHFIVLETKTCLSYKRDRTPLYFWRTTHQDEVDLILGDQLAIEIKSKKKTDKKDARGLEKLQDEGFKGQRIVVSQDQIEREKDGVHFMHWATFLEKFWNGTWL